MLGLFSDYTPKFAKHFAELGQEMQNAFAAYVHEVQAGTFPAAEHTFNMNEDVMNKLYWFALWEQVQVRDINDKFTLVAFINVGKNMLFADYSG